MLASARREPSLTLHLPDREPVAGVHFAFVSNSSPWTYANTRPVWTNPTTTFETGLGVFATTSMNVWANLGLVRRMLSKRPRHRGQAPDPRRRPAVGAGDERHARGVSDRRRLPRDRAKR